MFLKAIFLLAVQFLLLLNLGAGVSTKIVSTHRGTMGPEPCALVCSGTTGAGRTDWKKWATGEIYLWVDTRDCGFVGIPTVTTTMSVSVISKRITGTSQVAYVGAGGFRVYLQGFVDENGDLSPEYAKDRAYAINWLAVGYNC